MKPPSARVATRPVVREALSAAALLKRHAEEVQNLRKQLTEARDAQRLAARHGVSPARMLVARAGSVVGLGFTVGAISRHMGVISYPLAALR